MKLRRRNSWTGCGRKGSLPSLIVFNADQVRFLAGLIHRGIVPHSDPCVLFVLGRYTPNQQSAPSDLDPLLEATSFREAWFLCAFGKHELACVDRALARGGHARIGFENNFYRPDGTRAAGNAELVGLAATRSLQQGRPPANADQARELFSRALVGSVWNSVCLKKVGPLPCGAAHCEEKQPIANKDEPPMDTNGHE